MLAVPRFPSAQLGPDRYFLIAPLLRGPPPALRPRPRAVLGAGLAGRGGGPEGPGRSPGQPQAWQAQAHIEPPRPPGARGHQPRTPLALPGLAVSLTWAPRV